MADRTEVSRGLVTRTYVNRTYVNRGYGLPVRPLPPINLSGIPSTNSVQVTWTDTNSGAIAYRVEVSLDGVSYSTSGTTEVGGTFFVVGNLQPATDYYFRVYAFALVDSATAPVAQITTSSLPQIPPGTPIGLNALVLSSERIDLGWTPADQLDQGFQVQISLDSSNWTTITNPLTAPHAVSFSATGLATGTLYYFRVAGVNTFGSSAYSAPISATTQSPAQAPNAPTNLTVSLPSGGAAASQLNLSWVRNSTNETGFKIERSPNGVGSWVQIDIAAAGSTTYQNTGLASSTTYYYRIRATNTFGDSAYTPVRSGTTQSGGSTAPTAPTLNQPTSPSATQITLVWVSNATNTDSYTVYRGVASTNMVAIQTGITPDILTYTDNNAGPAGTYWYYAVAAVNGFGEGRSANRYVQSKPNAPAAPPQTLTSTTISPYTVRLDIPTNAAPTAIFSTWQWSTDGTTWPAGDTNNVWPNVPPASTDRQTQGYYNTFQAVFGSAPQRYYVSGLTPGQQYWFRLVNTNSGAASDPSNVVGPITMPTTASTVTAPTGVSGTALTAVTAVVQWTLQSTRLETGILVERSADAGSTWQVAAGNMFAGSSYLVDSGLIPGATYRWRVTSFTGRTQTGYQTYSYVSSATSTSSSGIILSGTSGSAPTTPSLLTASAYDDTRVSLEWQLNAEDELGTSVEISTNGGSSWNQITTVGKWVWSCYVTGLVASTSYQFRIRTFNAGGYSSYTSAVTVSTLAAGHNYTGDLALASVPATIGITPQRLATYRQMQIDYNNGSPINYGGTLYAIIKTRADNTLAFMQSGNTAGLGYLDAWGDVGWYAALMYQLTGATAYAQAAYTMLITNPAGVSSTYGGQITVRPVYLLRGSPAFNYVSACTQQVQMIYDWCRGAWTSDQQAVVQSGIEAWIAYANGWNQKQYTGGMRLGPAQETNINSFGWAYYAAAVWDVLNYSTTAGTWTLQSQFIPYGGIQPSYSTQTGPTSDCTTYCNESMGTWAYQRSDGEGAESTEYDDKTAVSFACNVELIRQSRSVNGDNVEYHPVARTGARKNGFGIMAHFSSDLQQMFKFGDNGNPHSFGNNGFIRSTMHPIGLIANASRGNVTIGPVVNGFAQEIFNKNGAAPWGGSNTPYWGWYLGVDPYITTAPRSTLAKGHAAMVQGFVTYHTGYSNSDTAFYTMMIRNNWTDHQAYQFGNWGLYRKGEWAITYANGYGGPGIYSDCANQLQLGGFGNFGNLFCTPTTQRGTQRIITSKFNTSPDFTYAVGETWGPFYAVAAIYGGTPPTFVQEWTRSIVHIPSSDALSDTVITFDRVLAANPNNLPNGGGTGTGIGFYATYPASDSLGDRTRINGNPISNVPDSANTSVPSSPGTPALVQFIQHCATAPTINGGGTSVTWTTSGAINYSGVNNLKLVPLLPTGSTVATYTDSVIFFPPYRNNIAGSATLPTVSNGTPYSPEARYQVRIWPSTAWPNDANNYWYVFLNVVFATDISGGPTTSAITVQDGTGTIAAGTRITRTSLNDVVVMFSQVPSTGSWPTTTFNRVLQSGYTFTWTATTATTNVILCDLSTSKTWTYTIDGGGSQSLSVDSSSGVGVIAVTGTGSHTIVLTGI